MSSVDSLLIGLQLVLHGPERVKFQSWRGRHRVTLKLVLFFNLLLLDFDQILGLLISSLHVEIIVNRDGGTVVLGHLF